MTCRKTQGDRFFVGSALWSEEWKVEKWNPHVLLIKSSLMLVDAFFCWFISLILRQLTTPFTPWLHGEGTGFISTSGISFQTHGLNMFTALVFVSFLHFHGHKLRNSINFSIPNDISPSCLPRKNNGQIFHSQPYFHMYIYIRTHISLGGTFYSLISSFQICFNPHSQKR